MAKLDGEVAVITSASSSLGEATAETLAAEGDSIVVATRRKERLSALDERINGNGGKTLSVECDVTDEEQTHGLIQKAKDELGQVAILVNNASMI